jgi:GTPase Era involved in 16S rRNA processing
MEQPDWRSPRKIEEDVKRYRSKRFEDYMKMEERGEITRELALAALREEIEYSDQATETDEYNAA